MLVLKTLISVLTVNILVEAVPVIFKEKTPNGEAIVAISSSDPNVEKYFTQQFSTRSGFTQLTSEDQDRLNYRGQRPPGAVHSSISIAVPGKAIAGAGRSFASASSGPFLPIFSFPISHESFGFSSFDPNEWVRNLESFYNSNSGGHNQVNSVAAVNDNGHVYGHVNSLAFDNRARSPENYVNGLKNFATLDTKAQKPEAIDLKDNIEPMFEKKPKNLPSYDNKSKQRSYE